jgi:hypothetical protein
MTDKTNVFTALIKAQPHFLERPLADLLPMRFMGDVAVNAYRGLIKHLNDLPLSLEEKQSRLKDGQDAGKALLMIEARIGELLPTAEEARKNAVGGTRVGPDGTTRKGGGVSTLPPGISSKQAQRARAISTHPHEVAEAIDEAIENEDIPTKTAVLNKIAYKQELARVKGTRAKTQIEMAADAYLYYSKLEDALHLIPSAPPKELKEKDFLQIKAVALSIIHKLEVFNGTQSEGSAGSGRRLSQGKR